MAVLRSYGVATIARAQRKKRADELNVTYMHGYEKRGQGGCSLPRAGRIHGRAARSGDYLKREGVSGVPSPYGEQCWDFIPAYEG